MRSNRLYILLFILATFISACGANTEFDELCNLPDWELQLNDDCTQDWHTNWFLDGQLATINHSEQGMDFAAGPINRNDAHHAVLWTKQSFDGDIKIEYDYTRTDSQIVNVNILYIQASGNEKQGFAKDISLWNEDRTVPTMSKYYYGMDPIHISYSAFKMVNDDPEADYIRVRKYPAEQGKFKETGLLPDFFKTGLFKTNITYHITVVKSGNRLLFNVEDDGEQHLYAWTLTEEQQVQEGRIGLRHMYTRSACYKNFKVYTK